MEILIYVLVGWFICGLGATAYIIYDALVKHDEDFKYEDLVMSVWCAIGGVITVGYLLVEIHRELLRDNPVIFSLKKKPQEET